MVRSSDVLLMLVAILFPPAAVAIISGCSCDLLINVLLSLFGVLPGHLHAFWLIYKKLCAEEQYGPGGFIYIGNGTYEPAGHAHTAQGPNYGAIQG